MYESVCVRICVAKNKNIKNKNTIEIFKKIKYTLVFINYIQNVYYSKYFILISNLK